MQESKGGAAPDKTNKVAEKNDEAILKLFNAYFRDHNHTGKLYDDFPSFLLFRPSVLEGREIATRGSEKLLLNDVIQRAKERNGYIGVSKHRNPKLGYYWLELSVMPFMMGDAVSKDNKGEFFYILTKFIEFTKQHPKMYGDLTAEVESDKDILLMLNGIKKNGGPPQRITRNLPGEHAGVVQPELACDGSQKVAAIAQGKRPGLV